MATTKEPVTVGGWYELQDGRVQRFSWVQGRLRSGQIVESWADVPDEEDSWAAADRAELRKGG